MPKMKLQFKITLLITGLSLLFIFVFTSIQLRNHLDKLNSYNKYRAKVGTIIIKTTLELLLKDVQGEETLKGMFEAAIESFSKEEVVEKVSILAMNGDVMATNDPLVREFGETRADIETYYRLSKEAGTGAWFYSAMNDKTRMFDIYIPIDIGPASKYIVKLSFSIANIEKAMRDILTPIILTVVIVIIGNLFLGFMLMNTVVRPIGMLNYATKDIAAGNLDLAVNIDTHDEIQELGDTFNDMTKALRKMKERAENANPLTKLPGNNVIREEIEGRIARKEKFVAVHVDLDNFKAYNDRYGIAKGDEVIKFTSNVLAKALQDRGSQGDFLGHEGGDDFFFITSPEKADALTGQVISDFDSGIRGFYSEEERRRGFIVEADRKGATVKFPIMTISMAGVSNQFAAISGYAELTNVAVGVKKKAKSEARSNFFLDRRKA
jgi:GGDEF domain-containing protein/uncharacterized membrane protein